MDLIRYLDQAAVVRCSAVDKAAVLATLSDLLSSRLSCKQEMLLQAVLQRESLMSTGIGQGLAVPHVRLADLKRAQMAVAICPDGVDDYQSLDDEPVRIIVLIAAPRGQHETYIRLLAAVVDVLKDSDVRDELLALVEAEDIWRLLTGGQQ